MKKIASVLLLSVIATPAFADEVVPATASDATAVVATPASVNGYYVAADLGMASYSNTASVYDGSALPNPLALQLSGGYRYNQYLAAEAGYSFFGDSILKSTGAVVLTETLKASVSHVAAVGTYAINGKFDVFGKLGLANTALDYSYSSSTHVPASGSGSARKINLMFGLGGTYKINDRYSVRAQYENFGKTTLTNIYSNGQTTAADIGLTVISVGGVYRF